MITATLNGRTFDYAEIKIGGMTLNTDDDADPADQTFGLHRVEASGSVSLRRRDWKRLRKALRPRVPRRWWGVPLGRLNGRRAWARDVRTPSVPEVLRMDVTVRPGVVLRDVPVEIVPLT